MDAFTFLARARRHASDHVDEIPCDPATYGLVCAHLSALVAELELDESRIQADIAAAAHTAREGLQEGYRRFLRGGNAAE